MAETAPVKVICYMRNGFELHYGRLPLCPRIPPTPEEIELHPVALKSLRQDPRICFLTADELKAHNAAIEAKAADLKERQAAAEAKRKKAERDTTPDDDTKPGKPRPKRRVREE